MVGFVQIVVGAGVFAIALLLLTYGSALVADLTGLFHLLFIKRPHRSIFRFVRWLIAAAATFGILSAIE